MADFKLINMNGRLYDPVVGRFLNPDNFVQQPGNTQSYNRYSYCLNNPLKYTDPSGEAAEWLVWAGIQVANYSINFANNWTKTGSFKEAFKSTPLMVNGTVNTSNGNLSSSQLDAYKSIEIPDLKFQVQSQSWTPNLDFSIKSLVATDGGGDGNDGITTGLIGYGLYRFDDAGLSL